MKRPEWVKCITREKEVSWCGRDLWVEWCFLDLEHAEKAVERGDRLEPCKRCLKAARKGKR